MQGTVKWFDRTKGFGFITEDGCDTEWFVHVSGTLDKVIEGDKVEFDESQGRNGKPCAVNVRRIKVK